MMRYADFWTVPREWAGETVFIVGGGTSVLQQDIGLLRGRRVIVINSSYETVPFADFLITHDAQWWPVHRDALASSKFQGRIVTVTTSRQRDEGRRLFVRQKYPPGLSSDPSMIAMRRTTFSGAVGLAVHLGAAALVLLGADGRMGADGRSHHHTPHKWWKFLPGRWDKHRAELQTLVEPLRKLGIPVLNASPGSAWDLWPVMTLHEALAQIDGRKAA